jgi:hypothetical protein
MQEVEGNMTQFREQDYPIDSFVMVRPRGSNFTGRAGGSFRHVVIVKRPQIPNDPQRWQDYDWFGPDPCGPSGAQGNYSCGDFGYKGR